MPVIAYLANEFPSPVEPYVVDEIGELRRRGTEVIPCSARRARSGGDDEALKKQTLYLEPIQVGILLRAAWLCGRRAGLLRDLLWRILFQGREPVSRRMRALLHTWLGAYYALLLRERGVEHIHVHHGYFSSWVAMVAARFLNVGFSFTLHGSDLLLHPAWLDVKLHNCDFCLTISEFNRQHILSTYPQIGAEKIWVQRMGVDTSSAASVTFAKNRRFTLLAVGRLHPVKDHAFLLRACAELLARGVPICCWVAGEGAERERLQELVFDLGLCGRVHLLGHLAKNQLDVCYRNADLVVLTSRSEGIPLTLMEAMARGVPVLAPAITGIPELVVDGITGFLYQPGNMNDFIRQIEHIRGGASDLQAVTAAARRRVFEHFDRDKNLKNFAEIFLHRINARHSVVKEEATSHAHTVLQQI